MKGIILTLLICCYFFHPLECRPEGNNQYQQSRALFGNNQYAYQSNRQEAYKYGPPENQAYNGGQFGNNGNNQFGYQPNRAEVNNFRSVSNKRVIATQVWKLDESSGEVSVEGFFTYKDPQGQTQKISFTADRNGYCPQPPSFKSISTDMLPRLAASGGFGGGTTAMMISLGGIPPLG